MVTGAKDIKKAVEEFAGIKEGETSEDGLFTLTEVECLGACVNAPMIQVNNKVDPLTRSASLGLPPTPHPPHTYTHRRHHTPRHHHPSARRDDAAPLLLQEFYEFLTPEIMKGLMQDWKDGKTPKAYNQNHVKTCEGPQGKTTLLTDLGAPPCRDLDALKAELAAAKEDADK